MRLACAELEQRSLGQQMKSEHAQRALESRLMAMQADLQAAQVTQLSSDRKSSDETALFLKYKKAQGKLATENAALQHRLRREQESHSHFVAEQQKATEQMREDIDASYKRDMAEMRTSQEGVGHSLKQRADATISSLESLNATLQAQLEAAAEVNEAVTGKLNAALLGADGAALQSEVRVGGLEAAGAKGAAEIGALRLALAEAAAARDRAAAEASSRMEQGQKDAAAVAAALQSANVSLVTANAALKVQLAAAAEQAASSAHRTAAVAVASVWIQTSPSPRGSGSRRGSPRRGSPRGDSTGTSPRSPAAAAAAAAIQEGVPPASGAAAQALQLEPVEDEGALEQLRVAHAAEIERLLEMHAANLSRQQAQHEQAASALTQKVHTPPPRGGVAVVQVATAEATNSHIEAELALQRLQAGRKRELSALGATNQGLQEAARLAGQVAICIEIDEFCIKNDELFIKMVILMQIPRPWGR